MAQDKDKNVVDFSTQDAEYASKIASVKGGKVPLGGAPMPPVPRFDQQPQDRHQGVQNSKAGHHLLSPQQREELAGQMIPGVGSAYAANQPATRQNVVEIQQPAPQQQGNFINPPRPEGAGLRPETVQGLEAIAKANTDEKAKEDDKEFEPDELDGYETDEFGNRIKSLLNNRKRRDEIEKRCEPLRIEDLITIGEVRQRVPVLPKVLEPTYRSVGGNEDIFIKKLVSPERGSEQYIIDLYTLMNLTAGLHALNGRELPTHLKDGEPDELLFRAKMKVVAKMPLALLADISVNYVWFSRRVQKLFVADNIKGF